MKKPWSISTTIRNPERIRGLLKILKLIEGVKWTRENQKRFQIMLIQYKIYGYGSQQFYQGLSNEHLNLLSNVEPIKFNEAEKILESKKYKGGGDMRGRQSFNPLEKMGLAFLDNENKIRISSFGNAFLKEKYDLGEIFFKSFLKWQLPNPNSKDFKSKDGFNINPFIATLKLIYLTNNKWSKLNNEPVGISKKEFSLFVPTLINYKDIDDVAEKIIHLRLHIQKVSDKKTFFNNFRKDYVAKFLDNSDNDLIDSTLRNLQEYTDNIIRYFRLTRFIYIRGNGYYIDLEPRRTIEIKCLLNSYNGQALDFKNNEEYIDYISDITLPELPWETRDNLIEITINIIEEIRNLEKISGIIKLKEKNLLNLSKEQINNYIDELRLMRRNLQERINYNDSQDLDRIREYILILKEKIYSMENRPLILEKYITLSLNALNDALEIIPNYPVGDDNEPTCTAPAGEPDIVCLYKNFNSICEVTLLRDKSQWFNEGQPVMRHLRDFEEKNLEKKAICLFIAPSLHIDTIETFWVSIKYGYRGKCQKIVPFSLKQFIELLEILIISKENNKTISHIDLCELYEQILDLNGISNSEEWINIIPNKINNWKRRILL